MLQVANNNHTPDSRLEDNISGLFEKYYSQFSRLVGPTRENDRVEIDFQQRIAILGGVKPVAPLLNQSIENYNIFERACHLDNIETVLGDGLHGNPILQEIREGRKKICKQLGYEHTTSWDAIARGHLRTHQTETLSPAEILEGNGTLFIPHTTQTILDIISQAEKGTTVSDIVSEVENLPVVANNNIREVTLEERRARGLPYLLSLFGLIQKFTQIHAQDREEFIRTLQVLDTQGKIEPVVYRIKYELSLLLEIPEMSTWKAILAKMEEKFPNAGWTQKAA